MKNGLMRNLRSVTGQEWALTAAAVAAVAVIALGTGGLSHAPAAPEGSAGSPVRVADERPVVAPSPVAVLPAVIAPAAPAQRAANAAAVPASPKAPGAKRQADPVATTPAPTSAARTAEPKLKPAAPDPDEIITVDDPPPGDLWDGDTSGDENQPHPVEPTGPAADTFSSGDDRHG